MENNTLLPDYSRLFLEFPLYNKLEIESDAPTCFYLFHLFTFGGIIDAFCPSCGKTSTFQGVDSENILEHSNLGKLELGRMMQLGYRDNISFFENKSWHVRMRCTRVKEHRMLFSFHIADGKLIKVGQYPSQADLTLPELKKYQPILSKEKFHELNKGIGLVSHGVGIGAFVYLRRVFEDLIEEAHHLEMVESHWDEDLYKRSRIKEKIEILQHRLPVFLVENKSMYSILSKGIHELSEKDCLDFFPAMKLSIELILDEKLERFLKKKKIEEAKASIAKIQAQLGEQ